MEIRKQTYLCLLAILCDTSTIALAQTQAETQAAKLTKISEATAILNSRKTHLDAQMTVLSKESEIRKQREIDGNITQPTVKSIESLDGIFTAEIAYGLSVTEDVHIGEKIHGGWTVISINANSVIIRRGKNTLRLTLGGDSTSIKTDVEGRKTIRASTTSSEIPLPRGQ